LTPPPTELRWWPARRCDEDLDAIADLADRDSPGQIRADVAQGDLPGWGERETSSGPRPSLPKEIRFARPAKPRNSLPGPVSREKAVRVRWSTAPALAGREQISAGDRMWFYTGTQTSTQIEEYSFMAPILEWLAPFGGCVELFFSRSAGSTRTTCETPLSCNAAAS
jgi:hypothetical protein